MNKKFTLILFLLFLTASYSQAQDNPVGNWIMLFNQSRMTDKLSLHAELQYRSFEIKPNTDQLLLRTGINYHISNSSFATIGYANISNYAFDKEQAPGVQARENRLWQQFLMRNNLGRFFFEHRYRLEQRWLKSQTGTRYLDRVRYLFRVSVPLNKKLIEKNTFFLIVYDEVFIHISETPFDRNRLYAAIGYQFLPAMNVQLGYLAQTVNTTTKHYLQTGITYNIDLRNKIQQ